MMTTDHDAPNYCPECGVAPCEGHDVPRVGDLAKHHSGILDPYPVTTVLDGGGAILVRVADGVNGVLGPLPAERYAFHQPEVTR